MLRRWLALALCGVSVLAALALALSPSVVRASAPKWVPGRACGGELVVRGGLPLLTLCGSPSERGHQQAALVSGVARDLLGFMSLPAHVPIQRSRSYIDGCVAAIRPADRAEITAFADAGGISAATLLRTNALIETMCSAVVRTGPEGTRIGRNMDFSPADALGASTVIAVIREPGRHTYAAVTWPGMFGVISGINDRGLVACILLNWTGVPAGPAEPLALRARHVLQDCADVEAAVAAFAAAPVGSAHYLLLADPRHACVVWRDVDGLHRDDPVAGWLVIDNAKRLAGASVGERAAALGREVVQHGHGLPTLAWCRRATTASYMPCDNAQAMTFDCGARRLELARGTTITAAALHPWVGIDLGALFDDSARDAVRVEVLPASEPLRHYLSD